jgi:hypothetical protein
MKKLILHIWQSVHSNLSPARERKLLRVQRFFCEHSRQRFTVE